MLIRQVDLEEHTQKQKPRNTVSQLASQFFPNDTSIASRARMGDYNHFV